MEKSIEERAREYAEKSFAQRIKIPEEEITEWQKSRIINGYVAVYTKIATEQKAIDDEEQGKELLYAVIATEERTKREMIRKAKRWAEEQNFSVSVQLDLIKTLEE